MCKQNTTKPFFFSTEHIIPPRTTQTSFTTTNVDVKNDCRHVRKIIKNNKKQGMENKKITAQWSMFG